MHSSRANTVQMADVSSVLIIQNKGGGHGEIGFHLAKQLTAKGKVCVIVPRFYHRD